MNFFSLKEGSASGFFQKVCTSTLLIIFLVTTVLIPLERAEAVYPVNVVGGPGSAADIQSAVSNTATAGFTGTLVKKEFTLDGLLFAIARGILNQIRRSIIRWISSGFNGSPSFVTDLNQFLINAVDQAAGNYIFGTELGFLCRPFQINVRLGLALNYRNDRDRIRCTISGAINNVNNIRVNIDTDRFLAGDFTAGGFPGWYELTQKPQNNFFGAQGIAQQILDERLSNTQNIKLNVLNWGNGTLSKEICQFIGAQEKCSITLPGKAISEMLTFELQSGEQALLTADEINEVITALFAQLAQQALTGAAGLLGLSSTGGSFGAVSFLDRMGNQQYDPVPDPTGTGVVEGGIFGPALTGENEYRALYAGVVSRAEAIIVQAQSSGACTDTPNIIAQTTPILNEALTKQNAADANIALLRGLQGQYNLADEEGRLVIAQELVALEGSGRLHSTLSNTTEQFRVNELLGALNGIASQLNSLCGTPGGGQTGGE